jgi:hypothetical protein
VLRETIALGERIKDDTSSLPAAWHSLGDVLLATSQLEPARDAYERALSHPQRAKMAKLDLAETKWGLARVSWGLGDHARALRLAAEADALYRQAAPGEIGDAVKNLNAWRKAHDPGYTASN